MPGGPPRFYSQLPHEQRAKLLKERLKKYTQRVRSSMKHEARNEQSPACLFALAGRREYCKLAWPENPIN